MAFVREFIDPNTYDATHDINGVPVGSDDYSTLPTWENYHRQGNVFTDFFDPQLQATYDKRYEMWRQDTAYQRKVEDLIKAGLNPVLATGGQGSESSFSAGTTQSNIGHIAKMSPVVADMVLRAKQVFANVNETEARTKQIKALTQQIEDGENLPPKNLLTRILKDILEMRQSGDVPSSSFNSSAGANARQTFLDVIGSFLLSFLN